MAGLTDFFFPYQKRWLADKSKVKIFEKSRRIGGTWVQSFEDVQDCIEQPGLKVFFSSADMTAAAEYIDYCESWIQKLNAIAKALAEINSEDIEDCVFADEDKGVKSKLIEFCNGSKIYVLSSNPKAFRSKGGKIVWDEAAHHENDQKMWAAAKPAAMWGYPIRILSTHSSPSKKASPTVSAGASSPRRNARNGWNRSTKGASPKPSGKRNTAATRRTNPRP